ncbi:hypothetical protein [Streptomyces sp. NBC_01423]|uniref:hypothetical protein n=1 Tax=Streptomyces sp. NBC_01423 TaxID=2903860 RepID=UPI002E28E525|nr:hypothetical protein [Streptomyces sp. NBC_01423]
MLDGLEEALPALRAHRRSDLPPVDWAFIEREVGCAFPADFVELSTYYPPFVLDEFLSIHVPEAGRERNFVAGIRQTTGTLAGLRDDGMSWATRRSRSTDPTTRSERLPDSVPHRLDHEFDADTDTAGAVTTMSGDLVRPRAVPYSP